MLTGNILITGAGTLTKAILTVAARKQWDARFTVFSRGELNQAQLRARFPDARFVIGDVRDYERVNAAIVGHETVIHGAALKRIPECEQQPDECWKTNVMGSAHVARACQLQGVKRCIGISTDKACRATTMYGASKLQMEKIFRAQIGDCIFTLVRYGNVVASRGSVLELWQRQAAAGQPLTITRMSMTRFFMSPYQAVELIDYAATSAHGLCVVPKLGSLSLAALAQLVVPNAASRQIGLRSEEKKNEDLIHVDERAKEYATYFVIGLGELGHSYTSDTAPLIAPETFRQMLTDAKELE